MKINRFILIIVFFILFSFLPLFSITNSNRYFSPNLDGIKDIIKIPLIIVEKDLVYWKLLILKKKGDKFKKIKTFESVKIKEQQVTFEKFFERIIEKDIAIVPPEFVIWDGTDESGNQVEDGVYYFRIEAADRTGNFSKSPFIPIIVDTVTPQANYVLTDDIFSPNFDDQKETLNLKISVEDMQNLDDWKIEISKEGETVKTFKKSNLKDNAPNTQKTEWQIQWNGSVPEGELPEGVYQIQIFASDLAGNRYIGKIENFELVRTYEEAKLAISSEIFSPNDDQYYDRISFELDLSSIKGLLWWEIDIYNDQSDLVRTLSNQTFKKLVLFDGRDQEGKTLEDGEYAAKAQFFFRSGNKPTTESISFEIDNQAPQIALILENKIFNPKAEIGGNKTVRIQQIIEAEKQDQFQGAIINESGEIIWQKKFENLEPVFTWDGENNEGKFIQGRYIYQLTGEDNVGNSTTVTSDPFEMITEKIEADFSVSNQALSPNGDGFYEEVNFYHQLTPIYYSNLIGGKLQIRNSNQQIVKSYFFSNDIPALSWNGLMNEGKKFPDGIYTFTAKFRFTTEEEITTYPKKIYLDTTPVDLEIIAGKDIFSPNNDGFLDNLTLSNNYQKSTLKPDQDRFILKIKNTNGTIYQEHDFKGRIPSKIVWQGNDQLRNPTPEGYYIYEIDTIDHAFNLKIYRSGVIKLVRKIEDLEISLDNLYLSSYPQATEKSVAITPLLFENEDLEKIEYFIEDDQRNTFSLGEKKTLEDLVVTYKKTLPEELKGVLTNPGGIFQVKATAKFRSGNRPSSPSKKLIIDNTPPQILIRTRPDLFSPDQDGVNEILDIRIKAKDNIELKNLTVYIFRIVKSLNQKPFKQTFKNYYKNQLPIKVWNYQINQPEFDKYLKWDGRGNLGQLVESATDYIIFVKTEDQVGISTLAQTKFSVDILVEVLDDKSLKIILNSILFKYNSDEMVGDYKKVLNLLVKMLRKYPDYKVLVQGHTDSRGSDSYNQRLSITRAKKIYQYLTKKLPKERFSYEGKGKSQLKIEPEVIENTELSKENLEKIIEDNYRQNRRVEFYLKKPTK